MLKPETAGFRETKAIPVLSSGPLALNGRARMSRGSLSRAAAIKPTLNLNQSTSTDALRHIVLVSPVD